MLPPSRFYVSMSYLGVAYQNDIPVIMAFNRCDGTSLRLYEKKGTTLVQTNELCSSHYFVVTGTYSNPNMPDKHFLTISTWGEERYICLEEYLYGKGSNLFSSYMEITFSK